MKLFIAVLLFTITLATAAQQKDNRITIGSTDSVYSNILRETRRILVHVPAGDKNRHYPVLYILDGDQHFQSAVAITEQLSGLLPEMIVIGIANTDRERDMTPTHVQPDKLVNSNEAARSGGGENFIRFIQTELMPYVDSHYSTTTYRVISGHSLGGLAVLNVFFNHTDLFNAYIAIDPSIWWENRQWIERNQNRLSQIKLNNRSLFVAIANNLPPGMDTLSVFNDTTVNTVFPRSVLGFVQRLRNTDLPGLSWSSKFYPNEWHGVVELNAEYDALRYLFNWYRFDMRALRSNPDANADSLIDEHYKKVSAIIGYRMLPSEGNVNDLAYFYLGNKQFEKAYALFKRNTDNYPASANAFDSLGDYYVEVGDTKQAIAAFTRSLRLAETADTRRKLNTLLK